MHRFFSAAIGCGLIVVLIFGSRGGVRAATLRGRIVDSESQELIAARLYIESAAGKWFHAQSADPAGSAVEYRVERGEASIEVHTSLSAHPFLADLPPGEYTITVERGKEYLPWVKNIQLDDEPIDLVIPLVRWIDMSTAGWYSGETHVHRSLRELPTAMLAEDLNVALPLSYWETRSHVPPTRGDRSAVAVAPEPDYIDATHVVYPLNTEYEIFTVKGKPHTLGAVFALNHQRPLELGAPPVRAIAEEVHRQRGLLELDKHNWPWSMMLVPVMQVDLYELTNNHLWRTEFLFRQFGEAPAEYMDVEQDARGMTEEGWIDFTLENYYALLSCGFRMRPTAGTASGVHPVPLGFGRVYVHLDEEFSYERWIEGLDRSRSFVTTGPMLSITVDGEWPGHSFEAPQGKHRIAGWVRSADPLTRIELVCGDQPPQELGPIENRRLENGGYETRVDTMVSIDAEDSTWWAVRCYQRNAAGRVRFAHTAPFWFDVPDRPVRPRRQQVEYLIRRVREQLERNATVLDEAELAEYRAALATYEEIARRAR